MTTLTQLSVKTPAVATRPEVELLLCCARTSVDSERAERITTVLQENIDWAYLIQTAVHHGVMPLLYWNLNATCSKAVPKAILGQLRGHFHANALRNRFLTGELLLLLNLFEAHGIPAIPFKGLILAASAYGNIAFRQFGDLDILVQERDVAKVTDLLISQGYRPPIQLTDAQERPYLQFEQFFDSAQYKGSFGFEHKDKHVFLDLHWSLTPKDFPFRVDLKRWWENIEPVSLVGTTVPSFSPEDLLLFLCMHGSKHCWERLGWICDVAELIRVHQKMDWRQVIEQADTLGNKRMLFLGLLLAADLLDAPLPAEVWQKMQADEVAKLLAKQVREHFFNEANNPLEDIRSDLFRFRAMERLQDRIRYLLHLVTTPTEKDWEFLPLLASVCSLYYLLRPIRLAGKYGVILLKRGLRF